MMAEHNYFTINMTIMKNARELLLTCEIRNCKWWRCMATKIGPKIFANINQRYFYIHVRILASTASTMCVICAHFIFEAFDQPWKAMLNKIGEVEAHWGIMTNNRQEKRISTWLNQNQH